MNAEDRFWQKVTVHPLGCWLWTGDLNSRGYGRFRVDGRKPLAHRFIYELYVGPIPDGLHIDHLCRTKSCVNPAHMEPVTNRENILRGRAATKTHCKHGHLLDGVVRPAGQHPRRRCLTCHRLGERRRKERERAR